MEILASNNVVIKSNIDYEELDGLSRYIITRQEEIFDYLNLNTSKMCKIHILDKKEALDMLYKELIFTEQDKNSRKEVPSSIGSFLYEDDFFILNYEDYTNSYLHSKTSIDDYYAEVVAGIVPIFQKWRFGKLSDSTIINQGLAAYLSGQDIDCRVLINSYVELIKSGNTKSYGDFYRYLDSLLGKEEMYNLLTKPIDEDRIHRLYDGYKSQFMASRSKK